ncbi:hypothetical protein JTE90_024149 [Oedothorax gibbosus]|uniref:Uncharacterized protein n=1 Tax=Oedothorax gibbosus TaxID=931172 RepID=A0AAV6U5T9_9ARAC|nr:hypothetical protein JTE90_024149 [Oedothorax gibbosus]
MEISKHIKTMRSVSSPPGIPPSPSEPTKTPVTKHFQPTDHNFQSKDCRRRHTTVLVPSSSFLSDVSSSPISPVPPDFRQEDGSVSSVFFSGE